MGACVVYFRGYCFVIVGLSVLCIDTHFIVKSEYIEETTAKAYKKTLTICFQMCFPVWIFYYIRWEVDKICNQRAYRNHLLDLYANLLTFFFSSSFFSSFRVELFYLKSNRMPVNCVFSFFSLSFRAQQEFKKKKKLDLFGFPRTRGLV